MVSRSSLDRCDAVTLQVPEASFDEASAFRFEAPGGMSRWAARGDLEISGFSVVFEKGIGSTPLAMQPTSFVFFLSSRTDGECCYRYGIALQNCPGACVTRIVNPSDHFQVSAGEFRRTEVLLNSNQIGASEYTVGISVVGDTPIEKYMPPDGMIFSAGTSP